MSDTIAAERAEPGPQTPLDDDELRRIETSAVVRINDGYVVVQPRLLFRAVQEIQNLRAEKAEWAKAGTDAVRVVAAELAALREAAQRIVDAGDYEELANATTVLRAALAAQTPPSRHEQ
jgi:hypothetical protein